MHRGLKATNVIFKKLSLNTIVNFMEWNLTDLGEILETLIFVRFFLSRTNFMVIVLTVTKPYAEKCRS